MKWNRDDWQGRSESNVRYSEKVMMWSISAMATILIGYGIVSLIKYVYEMVA